MNLVLFGISHKTAPVKIREKYSFSKKQLSEELCKLIKNELINEVVILSTCNRAEIYLTTDSLDKIKNFLQEELSIPDDELHYFYFLKDNDAIRQLFYVASGLDSQVIGENQILAQVKNAYFIAKETGTVKKYFNKLFLKAIEIGKLVRNMTKISAGNVSVGSIAIKLIESSSGTLNNKKILIIGTGKIGELVGKYLSDKGIYGVFVANRTYEKAIELAEKIAGKAIKFDNLTAELKKADIIISATASPHLILKKTDILETMRHRQSTTNHKLIIMDLALPRDVDPEVKSIDNVILYNLDDINLIIEDNYKQRLEEAVKAKEIIDEELEKFSESLEDASYWFYEKNNETKRTYTSLYW